MKERKQSLAVLSRVLIALGALALASVVMLAVDLVVRAAYLGESPLSGSSFGFSLSRYAIANQMAFVPLIVAGVAMRRNRHCAVAVLLAAWVVGALIPIAYTYASTSHYESFWDVHPLNYGSVFGLAVVVAAALVVVGVSRAAERRSLLVSDAQAENHGGDGSIGGNMAMRHCDMLRSFAKSKNGVEVAVEGESMSPSLVSGDRIRLVCCDGDMSLGDIVMYPGRHGGRPVVHRIVGEAGSCYHAMGDNSLKCDQVTHSELVGKIAAVNIGEVWHPVSAGLELSADIAKLGFRISELVKDGAIEQSSLAESLCRQRASTCRQWRFCLEAAMGV